MKPRDVVDIANSLSMYRRRNSKKLFSKKSASFSIELENALKELQHSEKTLTKTASKKKNKKTKTHQNHEIPQILESPPALPTPQAPIHIPAPQKLQPTKLSVETDISFHDNSVQKLEEFEDQEHENTHNENNNSNNHLQKKMKRFKDTGTSPSRHFKSIVAKNVMSPRISDLKLLREKDITIEQQSFKIRELSECIKHMETNMETLKNEKKDLSHINQTLLKENVHFRTAKKETENLEHAQELLIEQIENLQQKNNEFQMQS